MTRLFTVGLSHRTAPVELRESVDFSRGGAGEALAALAGRGISKEMVVLSTCNRAEIYAVAGPDGPDAVARFFADLETARHARFYRPVGTIGRIFIEIEAQAFAMDA